MKRFTAKTIAIFLIVTMLAACDNTQETTEVTSESTTVEVTDVSVSDAEIIEDFFEATVLEVYDGSLLVEPFEEYWVSGSAEMITVPYFGTTELQIGDIVGITFNGELAESYPAQIMGDVTVELIERPEDIVVDEIVDIPQQYIDLLNDYCEAINNGEDRSEYAMTQNEYYEINDTVNTSIFICDIYDEHDPLSDFGYALYDFDENGIPELVIGYLGENEYLGDCVYAMYTINDDGEVVRLFYSWSRSRKYIYENGYIANPGSNGAGWQSNARYLLEDGMITCVGRIDHFMSSLQETDVYAYFPNGELVLDYEVGETWPAQEYIVDEAFVEEWNNELHSLEIEYSAFYDYAVNHSIA